MEITDTNFSPTINSGKLVLLDFGASWCGPCRSIAPLIDQLEIEYLKRGVIIGKMDVDANKVTPAQFGVRQVPTMLLFKNGKMIDRITPPFTKANIESKLNQYLK